jgi:hypothetical protein
VIPDGSFRKVRVTVEDAEGVGMSGETHESE